MKYIYLLISIAFFAQKLNSQVNPGSTCDQAGCSTSGSYANLSGVPSLGQYSCLGSTPNANWLAIGIGTNGSVHLQLTQTTNSGSLIDVDFALYGPYSSVSDGCPIGPSTPTVDCSYSASATEYVDINSALAGQVYILLVTNFNGQPGTISLVQSPTQPSTSIVNCAINFSATTSQTPATCGQATGTATVTPDGGFAPYTYSWNAPGNPTTQTATNLAPGTYTCTITSSPNPTTGQLVNPTTVNVTVLNSNASYSSTSTPVSCPGGSDGTATATMNPVFGTLSYSWDDPNNQTSSTATGLAAGTYTCTINSSVGCTGTTTVTVTEIPGMIATISNQSDVTCYTGNDGVIEVNVTQGTPGYTYSWNNSSSITNIANDLSVGNHILTITDQNSCVITIAATLAEPSPLQISTLTNDTQICPENTATLDVTGVGGSSPYTFTWYENGTLIGTGTQITVDPEVTNTQYCVVLSEQCGSPAVDSCLFIYFPSPIQPILTPDKFESCIPGEFTFSNTSANGAEISTLYVSFSEGTTAMLNGTEPITVTFNDPTTYSYDMIVTSIYGCIYSNSQLNVVEVMPNPEADFTFSANPSTIFETSILMQDRSSFDVVDWAWTSPGSIPSYSYSENPTFTFPEGEVGQYPVTLLVTTENGCTDTVTQIMNIVPSILFYAPNTFTPDGDEFNQSWEFFVSGIDIYDFELLIFNRWGETIWETKDPSAKWDGTYNDQRIQEGTYSWRSIVKDPLTDNKLEFKGHINVLR